VQTDVHVNGLLQFGDTATSGIRLPPREGSVHYTHPHGKQHPGNSIVNDGSSRGPGQLAFLLDAAHGATTRVFEFEPRDPSDERRTTYLTVPARNGTAISTGNLESVTAEAGALTSLSVAGSSYLQGGLTLGDTKTYGKPTFTLQGSVEETMVHRNPVNVNETHARLSGQAHPADEWSVTKVGFQMQHQARSNLQFPAASGTILTTGNLQDISMFDGQLLNVSGTSHLRGPVRLGTNRSTPIQFSGYLEGDIVSRTAPRFADRRTNVEHVPAPYTWGLRTSAYCNNGVPSTANADTAQGIAARFPNWERYNGSWEGEHSQTLFDMSQEYSTHAGRLVFGTPSVCRALCLEVPERQCGIVVRSRYLRGSIRILGDPARARHFVTATPLAHGSECSFSAASGTLQDALWVQNLACQRAAVLDMTSDAVRAWGRDHMSLADMDVVVARCRSADGNDWMPCWDMELCGMHGSSANQWHAKTCEVSLRQHSTGAYLGTQAGERCYSHGKSGDSGTDLSTYKPTGFADSSVCLGWRAEPALWRFEPRPGAPGEQHLARVGACAELGAAQGPEATNRVHVLCDAYHGSSEGVGEGVHEDSFVKSLDYFEWGMGIEGVCGAYNTSVQSCVRDNDKARWEQAMQEKCLEYDDALLGPTRVPGCIIDMTFEGAVIITRANEQGEPDPDDMPAGFEPRAECDLGMSRVVVQARCSVERYMSVAHVKDDNGVDDQDNLIVASIGSGKGSFQLSTLQRLTTDPPTAFEPLLHECWLTHTRGPNCLLETHAFWDVDFYMRDEATRLAFQAPSDSQTQWFPDADGTIITAGNVEQISHLRGLQGGNNFIFASGDQPGDATTILDFAAMGTAPPERKSGALPQYTGPDGQLAHPIPEDGSVRLVFPDATGTVITTGNTDDLVFKSIKLEGLEVQIEANFGEPGSLTILNFGASSRVSGCFNFVAQEGDTAYTQMCALPPTNQNHILLPDVSGVVLTTGNLLGLPAISIPDEHLFVGGDVSLEGAIELGNPDNVTTIEMFTWIDGDVGLTFQSAGGMLDAEGERKISVNSMRLSVPHMSGIDRAIRQYLRHEAADLPVDVQHVKAYRSPVPATSRVNQSVCHTLLSSLDVPNYHALGYYLTARDVMSPTLLRGRPYAALLDINATEHALPRDSAADFACAGPDGAHDCSQVRFACADARPPRFGGEGGTYEHAQRNRARVAEEGNVTWRGIYSAEDPRCVFDGDISSGFQSSHVSTIPQDALLPVPPNSSGTGLTGRCVLGMTFSRPRVVSRFRIYVRAGYGANVVGARLEAFRPRAAAPPASASTSTSTPPPGGNASADSPVNGTSRQANATQDGGAEEDRVWEEDGEWEELFVFERPVREDEWNDVDLSHLTAASHVREPTDKGQDTLIAQHSRVAAAFFKAYTKVRFVGAACGLHGRRDGVQCRCDVGEMEWHHGVISQELSPLETGTRSFFVDQSVVVRSPDVAMVLKCAQLRWFPKHLGSEEQELSLPETSGHLLTTGAPPFAHCALACVLTLRGGRRPGICHV